MSELTSWYWTNCFAIGFDGSFSYTLKSIVALYVFLKMCNNKVNLKMGFKNLEAVFAECFMNEEEKALKEKKDAEIKAKIEETGMAEVGEVYMQTKQDMDADEKSKGNKALLLAFVFAAAILVINTITGYIN